jgi:glycosyltransferase involved in cell wall biosynthesis
MNYPRVIIIGETFRMVGGGGITLTNLFKDWPPDNIGVVTDLISLTNPETKYNYYQLGREEIKFPFPFHLFQTYFQSGPYTFKTGIGPGESGETGQGFFQKLKKLIRPQFDNLLHRTGLFAFFYNIKLSDSLKQWIVDFNPDIIYIQPFYRNMMRFGNLLFREMNIPYAIHMMDDSITYINKSIILRSYFQRLTGNDFRVLVNNATVRMCISEAMAEEYSVRYKNPFLHFRNPIEINKWLSFGDIDSREIIDSLKIIYSGRTYYPYFDSLLDVCRIVDHLNRQNRKVSLDISPFEKNPNFLRKIRDLKGIGFYTPVPAAEIPDLIKRYDLFLICEDFDREARRYLHFSISTRASEGMISGVPVLIYAPEESALCKYFFKTGSGFIIGERDTNKLESAILKLWNDNEYRQLISKNAVRTAMADSDSAVVRNNFRKALNINENEAVS